MELTAPKGIYLPDYVTVYEGITWLRFSYSLDDKVAPYRWPKLLTFQNRYFKWMSYNSDSCTINYKEVNVDDLAKTTTKKLKG